MLEPLRDGGPSEGHERAGGGELNGQGKAVQPAADLGDDAIGLPICTEADCTARARSTKSSAAAGRRGVPRHAA
jgi:hypothetical protein